MAKFVPQAELPVSDQAQIRREKLEALRAEGRDPFVQTRFAFTADSAKVRENFDALQGTSLSLAGRLMSKRGMGKVLFCDLQDAAGRIQLFVKIDELGEEEYGRFKKLDIGDIVGVTGEPFLTKTEEITIRVKKAILLSKSLLPLPEKFHGLSDKEIRFRQRYVDLIVNPEVKRNFVIRSQFIRFMRNYLDNMGYTEVETPVLNTIAGGASARPFITHHNTLDIDMYMRIATELPLKRLIIGGMDRVYEIGRIFRNEGMDPKHNPEFTSVELYQAYADFHDMMDIAEGIISGAAKEILGTYEVEWMGEKIDLAPGWRRMTMVEAVREYVGIDFDAISDDAEAVAAAKEKGIELNAAAEKTWGNALYACFDQKVEEHLVQPTFITMYPVEVSPLTKRSPDDPRLTERFEAFICRSEMGNAYSELNDPIDQRARFVKQMEQRERGDDETEMLDEDFLNAMEYGMPPTGGMGIGIDRCVMLLTGTDTIREVILFPTMKPEGMPVKKVVKKDKASSLTREEAFALLKKYNSDEFHIRHALTVEGVMRWFAKDLGYADEEEFWGQVGLLHDIDYEMWPDEHCRKAVELLKDGGANDDMIHAVCSHGFGICSDVEPEHEMEKVLFAADELTGLIWSYALMRPQKSCEGMEVKSLKKKFKDKKFAAGCSREIISEGAEKLGWELDTLLEKTVAAMQSCEQQVENACK